MLEEALSPALTPELRKAMGDAAVAAAASIGYIVVGTVEFLLDKRGSFYFMEMNTKIQVKGCGASCYRNDILGRPNRITDLCGYGRETSLQTGALLLEEVINSCGMEGLNAVIDTLKRRVSESQEQKDTSTPGWWKVMGY